MTDLLTTMQAEWPQILVGASFGFVGVCAFSLIVSMLCEYGDRIIEAVMMNGRMDTDNGEWN